MERCFQYAEISEYHMYIMLVSLHLYSSQGLNYNKTIPRDFQYFLIQKFLIKTCVTYQGEKLP